MSRKTGVHINVWRLLTAALMLSLSTLVLAAVEFVPYPGKRDASLVSVEMPDMVMLNFNTDAVGFTRTLLISLPGIVVAQDTPQSDECERAAAKKALGFTQKFLGSAKKVYVKDVRMQDSSDDYATAGILTDKGSLSTALIAEGLARSDNIDPDASWCT